jgi:hypothetical protein
MQIQITVPDEVVSLAAKAGLGTVDYVELLLDKIVALQSTQAPSQAGLRHDLLVDWEHYRTTGLHITGDEVDAWLRQLESGESVEPPALHT